MTDEERIEEYQELRREATKASRWFTAALVALVGCLVMAGMSGPVSGWPWLVGALGAASMMLWALTDLRHGQQLIALHLLEQRGWRARVT